MQKLLKKSVRITAMFLASVFMLLFVTWGSLNLLKFLIYREYYKMETTICDNPGLKDGFVCQDICVADYYNKFLVSGYMKDGSASRIYITDENNNISYITLNLRGESYTGNCSGIAIYDNIVYLSCDGAVHQVPLTTILSAKMGTAVEVLFSLPVNNRASFVFANEDAVYVGELHDGKDNVCENKIETPDGTNYAIISRYLRGKFEYADQIISIPDNVQGFCITDDGKIVLSTSGGLKSSKYIVYDLKELVRSQYTIDEVDVYFLGEVENEIKGPAMAGGLDYYNDGVITLSKSASNKYVFGKFFFANDIVKLDIK